MLIIDQVLISRKHEIDHSEVSVDPRLENKEKQKVIDDASFKAHPSDSNWSEEPAPDNFADEPILEVKTSHVANKQIENSLPLTRSQPATTLSDREETILKIRRSNQFKNFSDD